MFKIKRFTRADKAALRQLYKATNGFLTTPQGVNNLNARDIVRFKDIADQSLKGYRNIDPDQAKGLLGKIGLDKVSGDYDHLIHKYNDPRLLARYRRRFFPKSTEERKLTRFKNGKLDEWKDSILNNIDSTFQSKLNRYTSDFTNWKDKKSKQLDRIHLLSHDNYIRMIQKINPTRKINSISDLSESELKDFKSKFAKPTLIYDKLYNQKFNDNWSKVSDLIDQKLTATNKLNDIYNKESENINNKILSLQSHRKSPFMKKWIKYTNLRRDSIFDDLKRENNTRGPLSLEDTQLRDKFIRRIRKSNGTKIIGTGVGNDNYFGERDNIIGLSKNATPWSAGHEAGHAKFEEVHPEVENNRARKNPNLLNKLASEAGASAHALATGKVLGATPLLYQKGKQLLIDSFNTYLSNSMYDITNRFTNKVRNLN